MFSVVFFYAYLRKDTLVEIILSEGVVIPAVYLELKTDSKKSSHKNKLPILIFLETVKSFHCEALKL